MVYLNASSCCRFRAAPGGCHRQGVFVSPGTVGGADRPHHLQQNRRAQEGLWPGHHQPQGGRHGKGKQVFSKKKKKPGRKLIWQGHGSWVWISCGWGKNPHCSQGIWVRVKAELLRLGFYFTVHFEECGAGNTYLMERIILSAPHFQFTATVDGKFIYRDR